MRLASCLNRGSSPHGLEVSARADSGECFHGSNCYCSQEGFNRIQGVNGPRSPAGKVIDYGVWLDRDENEEMNSGRKLLARRKIEDLEGFCT